MTTPRMPTYRRKFSTVDPITGQESRVPDDFNQRPSVPNVRRTTTRVAGGPVPRPVNTPLIQTPDGVVQRTTGGPFVRDPRNIPTFNRGFSAVDPITGAESQIPDQFTRSTVPSVPGQATQAGQQQQGQRTAGDVPSIPDPGARTGGMQGVVAERAGMSGLPVVLPSDGSVQYYFNADANRIWAIDDQGRTYVPRVDRIHPVDNSGRVLVEANGQRFFADRDVRQGQYIDAQGDPIDLSRLPSGFELQLDERGKVLNRVPEGYSAATLQQLANAAIGAGGSREGRMEGPQVPSIPGVQRAQDFMGAQREAGQAPDPMRGGEPETVEGIQARLEQARGQVDSYDDAIAELEAELAITPADQRGPLNARMAQLKRERTRAEGFRKSAETQLTSAQKQQEQLTKQEADAQAQAEKEAAQQQATEQQESLSLVVQQRTSPLESTLTQLKAQDTRLMGPDDREENAIQQAEVTRLINAIREGAKRTMPIQTEQTAAFTARQMALHIDTGTGEVSYLNPDGQVSYGSPPVAWDATQDKFFVNLQGQWYPAQEGTAEGKTPEQAPLQDLGFEATIDRAYQQALISGDRETAETLNRLRRNRQVSR